jgi:D-glycero-alpha-D-manno-heptose-7-phosphate kinase
LTAGHARHYNTHAMRTILATAPTRICDCGGWTDTWFAGHGSVFHIAIEPGVRVRVDLKPFAGAEPMVTVEAASFGDRYEYRPGTRPWVKHPLLEAAIESVGVPPRAAVSITIDSAVPPGASTGTSAAVCVALIGALQAAGGLHADPAAIAAAAHAIETERLGQQSGVQDQLAAAYGGINFIDVFEYPHSRVHALRVSDKTRAALERQLLLVYLGRTHHSSAVHEAVVGDVSDVGPEHPVIVDLRRHAVQARDASLAGDLAALGSAMQANTDAQRRLHPSLVGSDAAHVIAIAAAYGALGWKVNGAGGDGGSVTILTGPDPASHQATGHAIEAAGAGYRVIPIRLAARGLQVREVDRG